MKWTKRIMSLLLAAAVFGGSWSILDGSYALAEETPDAAQEEQQIASPASATEPAASPTADTSLDTPSQTNDDKTTDASENTQEPDESASSPEGEEPDESEAKEPEEEKPEEQNPSEEETKSIKLNQASISLSVNGTRTLKATVTPADAAVTWKSADKSIATVDQNGKVTGIKAGTTTITARMDDNTSASCTVTVSAKPTVKLDTSSFSLYVNGTRTLKATVTPAGSAVTWKSADKSIATVDKNGKVTGIKAGKTTITARMDKNTSASCTVTVTNAPTTSGGVPTASGLPSASSDLLSSLTSQYTLPTNTPDYVVLTFSGKLNKNTDTILDALYLYDSFGTFFVNEEDIYSKDDRVRRIVGEGHSIGILLTEEDLTDVDTALAALDRANIELSTVCGVPTRLVAIEGGSEKNLSKKIYNALKKNGYRIWDWDYQVEGQATSDTTASENLEKELDTTGRVVVRMDTKKSTVSTLEDVLGFMSYASMTTQALADSDKPVCQLQ
jgi:uncharacterized protein YjdB